MFSADQGVTPTGAALAEAIDFDGTNDYLSRADFTGNADGNKFTFSAWIWIGPASEGTRRIYQTDGGTFSISVQNDPRFSVSATNSSGTPLLDISFSVGSLAQNTFTHLMISIDLSSTSNRFVYINDILQSPTWNTYTNGNIDFTRTSQGVGVSLPSTPTKSERLSNVFLDYTYRDLSVTANRRLFVTADLKPAAGQAALNPIMYLTMADPTQPGKNSGTGGDFTLTGTVARSGRGPNQYNAPYSDLDGTADYLERTTLLSGIADGKQFTIALCTNIDTLSTNPVFVIATSTTARLYVNVDNGTGDIDIGAYNSSGTIIFRAQANSGTLVTGRNYQFVASFDLSNTSNRYAYLNGQALTMTYLTYLNQDIDFAVAATPVYRVGRSAGIAYSNAKIGALWFNTSYIDLSQPANLAKFVTGTGIDAKPVDLGASGELPTGSSPLIYLPMYGNDAGKNYGTGGDFTVNSGPYTGARGPNEFWGNRANLTTSTTYLINTTALGTSTKTASFVYWFSTTSTSVQGHFDLSCTAGALGGLSMQVDIDATGLSTTLRGKNSAGTQILSTTYAWNRVINTIYNVMVCVDMTNSAKTKMYINGVDSGWTIGTHTNDFLDLSKARNIIGAYFDGTSGITGTMSEFYFTTEYIDFTQEANRLKFRDAFGNPVDLPSQITSLSIPNPLIYLRFDPASFGTNSGTGGNFTVNGTITDGGQL